MGRLLQKAENMRIYLFIFFDGASPLKTIDKTGLESLFTLKNG